VTGRPASIVASAGALLAAAVLILAGCGSASRPSSATSATSLTITLATPTRTAQISVRCDGAPSASGDWKLDPRSACEFIAAHRALLTEPPPRDRACAARFFGPEKLTIDGTLAGTPVARRVSRVNACEETDFERLRPLLGAMRVP
jgi:hypothetical protein